jgi:hypothetical protein
MFLLAINLGDQFQALIQGASSALQFFITASLVFLWVGTVLYFVILVVN